MMAPGERLLVTAFATRGFRRREYVLHATSERLLLVEPESSIAIPWRELDVLARHANELEVRTRTPLAMTLRLTSADEAQRVVDAFEESREQTGIFRRAGPSLEGTWGLLAVEGRSGGQIASLPFGRHPVGQLVYLPNGRMSVLLMAEERSKLGGHGLGAGTLEEKAAAFDSFLAYAGRYERLENRVIHYPEVASIPDFVGMPEERFVALDGERLVLSTPPMTENGALRTFDIVWQRVLT